MVREKKVSIVTELLIRGVLPLYFLSLMWKKSGWNPFVFVFRYRSYCKAVYDLLRYCYGISNLRLKGGFLWNLEEFRLTVEHFIVKLCTERLGSQTKPLGEDQLKTFFNAAKTLGLIPKGAVYGPYFDRARPIVEDFNRQQVKATRV